MQLAPHPACNQQERLLRRVQVRNHHYRTRTFCSESKFGFLLDIGNGEEPMDLHWKEPSREPLVKKEEWSCPPIATLPVPGNQ